MIKQVPLDRLGSTDEMAEIVAFLLSDRSSYINGRNDPRRWRRSRRVTAEASRHHGQPAPSTTRSVPVTKLACSDSR